eukprot:3962304-Ditylum_brightwellii.AAC.1
MLARPTIDLAHIGGILMPVKGVIYATSTTQKLNMHSLLEAELVGIKDVMPKILWTCYFMGAQGYKISINIVYQGNQSTMWLEMNSKGFSEK